ncbi:ABC transporter permease [Aeropyrum pernix]|uniref:ABC transporter permease n=1 Tax=Aeropyrum pernix TaxID=56636 RepID=UPI0013053C2A|nr:ABC transporter permease subunit [Aeropyrum pernix]
MRSSSIAGYTALLAAPAALYLLAFFYAPLAYLAVYSGEEGFLGPYLEVLTRPHYYVVIANSAAVAAATALAVMLLALVPSYYIALEAGGRERIVLLALFVSPFIVDVLLRTLSIKLVLTLVGVKPGWTATFIGLVYENLPLGILFAFAGVSGVSRSLVEAARTLGAGRLEVYRSVVAPLALPWLAAGFVVVFLISFTDYVVPSLLGGTTGFTVGSLIYHLILSGDRWDLGSAVTLMVTLLSAAAAYLVFRQAYRVL